MLAQEFEPFCPPNPIREDLPRLRVVLDDRNRNLQTGASITLSAHELLSSILTTSCHCNFYGNREFDDDPFFRFALNVATTANFRQALAHIDEPITGTGPVKIDAPPFPAICLKSATFVIDAEDEPAGLDSHGNMNFRGLCV